VDHMGWNDHGAKNWTLGQEWIYLGDYHMGWNDHGTKNWTLGQKLVFLEDCMCKSVM
jgi:hypothetical protein